MNQSVYFAPSFFSSYYYAPLAALVDGTNPPNPLQTLYRDRDGFAAIRELLVASGEFADVLIAEPVDNASIPSGRVPLAIIQPIEWEETDDSDPIVILRRVSFEIILICRSESSERGYAMLERLSSIVQNIILGSNLDGGCLPAYTLIRRGKVDRKVGRLPEQRMILTGEFSYFVQSANGHSSLE